MIFFRASKVLVKDHVGRTSGNQLISLCYLASIKTSTPLSFWLSKSLALKTFRIASSPFHQDEIQ